MGHLFLNGTKERRLVRACSYVYDGRRARVLLSGLRVGAEQLSPQENPFFPDGAL